MIDLLLPPLIAGLVIAGIAGPLGCFVVWRQMAFFGDALSHASLLGIALGIGLLSGPSIFITLAVCVAAGLLLGWLQDDRHISQDTLLGIISHSSLALALILISLSGIRVDVMAYMFGDILSVSANDLLWILLCGAAVLTVLVWRWRSWVMMTLNEDLAAAEGLPIKRDRFLLLLAFSTLVALAIKIVGVLLITSLMVIPAATARPFSQGPRVMSILAAAVGATAVISGLAQSWWLDLPTGPSIVFSAALLFLFSRLYPHQD